MELSDSIYTVAQLTGVIKDLFGQSAALREVAVRGELSNYRQHSSGHSYFTLKDKDSSLRGVMFRSDARTLRFTPRNGMQVMAFGRVGIYERDGTYQLYAQRLEPDGVGSLFLALEQLKASLQAEGWFEPSRKRPLPLLPRAVGVVTAASGAALRDIIKVARRRYPNLHMVIAGVLVQGKDAPDSIANGLQMVSGVPGVDVIIVGRGGGSMEELWAFNHEQVVRAIGASPVPVISAVGHQTDITLADLVADVRAATPSHAAELAVPQHIDWELALARQMSRLRIGVQRQLQLAKTNWRHLTERSVMERPMEVVYQHRQRTNELDHRLLQSSQRSLRNAQAQFGALVGQLDALNPLAVLARGFSVCRDQEGLVIRSVEQAPCGQRLEVQLLDGRLGCRVEEQVKNGHLLTCVQRGEGQDD